MKRLLLIASVLALAFTFSAPALAGHHDHLRGHRMNRRPVRIVVPHTHRRIRPRIGFQLSLGVPGAWYVPGAYDDPCFVPAPYFAPAPMAYYHALPVFAPARCRFFVGAHYVWNARRGVRLYHQGHRHHDDEDHYEYDEDEYDD